MMFLIISYQDWKLSTQKTKSSTFLEQRKKATIKAAVHYHHVAHS
jgi:hypothetical protein